MFCIAWCNPICMHGCCQYNFGATGFVLIIKEIPVPLIQKKKKDRKTRIHIGS